MKRYRTYTAKKFKIWKKVIFFAVVAVIIFALAVILGNNLKNKIENSDYGKVDLPETTAPKVENDKDKNEESVPHDEAFFAVSAGHLDLLGITEQSEANSRVEELKAQGFNAISFDLYDSEGMITYASPAVEAATKLSASEDLIPYDILEGAAARARNLGMSLTCVVVASDSLSDEICVGELSDMGFDSVIVRGFEKYTILDNAAVDEIKTYTSRIRKAAGEELAVSICFAPEFYRSPKNAPYLEKIYAVSEFLSIDMTEMTAEDTKAITVEIAGSFSAFHLRPVLMGEGNSEAQEIDKALTEAGISARQYLSDFVRSEETDGGED